MPYRKVPLVEGKIYHIFSRSIADYKIFTSASAYQRMVDTMAFYTFERPPCRFSLRKSNYDYKPALQSGSEKIVTLIAYCLMPTHFHLLLKQLKENGISKFINLVLKSYSKYFNEAHKRKGPLWEGRFKNVLVESDEQLLHLTRYIHLNPVSACLVNDPKDWKFSSYREYIDLANKNEKICEFTDYINMEKSLYKKFVEDRILYQRHLEKIKHLILE